jgi:hypothetical protein
MHTTKQNELKIECYIQKSLCCRGEACLAPTVERTCIDRNFSGLIS